MYWKKVSNCENCLFKFLNEIGFLYGKDVCDVVVVFEDGVELHYHGGEEDEKEIES